MPLPTDYGYTELGMLWRVCERFGISPREVDGWGQGERDMLIAWERIRQHEDSRK